MINMNKAQDENISFCPASGAAATGVSLSRPIFLRSWHDAYHRQDRCLRPASLYTASVSTAEWETGANGVLSSSTATPATEAIAEVMASVGIVTMVLTASVIPWEPKSVF